MTRARLDKLLARRDAQRAALEQWMRDNPPDWKLTNTPFAQWPKRRLMPGERIAEVSTWVAVPPPFDDGWYDADGEPVAQVASPGA